MASPVDIYVKDDSAAPAALEGVVVGVYTDLLKLLMALDSTDSDGKVSFLLDDPGIYEVRLFKTGVIFGKPKRIEVVDSIDVTSNTFDLSGHRFEVQPSLDPRVCRCVGRFVDISNHPVQNVTVRISALVEEGSQEPELVDGSQVLGGFTLELKTGQDGRVIADLVRGGQYRVTWSGEDSTVWEITVPDRPTVSLNDLIHPVPMSVTWDSTVAPGGSLSLAVGESVDVPVSVLLSNFETLTEGLGTWLQTTSPNAKLVDAGGVSVVRVSGVEAGTFLVQLTRLPGPPVVVPVRTPFPNSLTVTVTP